MTLVRHIRAAIPPKLKASLIGNAFAKRLLHLAIKKQQCRQHPYAPHTFHFDGHRNLGWSLGGLADTEKPYVAVASRILAKINAHTVWDVGANVGFWTMFFAAYRPTISRVVAYEPDAINLQWLTRNVEAFDESRVLVRTFALSSSKGSAVFQTDPITGATGTLETGETFISTHYGQKSPPISVRTTTIDDEIRHGIPPPDFIKLDVEGHEYDVLRGAPNAIRMKRPLILLEMTGPRSQATFTLLTQHAYRLFNPITCEHLAQPEYEVLAIPEERAMELGF